MIKSLSCLLLLLACQPFLTAQECLDQRTDLEEEDGNLPAPYYFQSPSDGNVLLATNTSLLDGSRLVHLFDRDLTLLSSQQYDVDWLSSIADMQARASGGYLGVINTPTIENAFSTYSIFLVEDASSPDNNIIYTSDPLEVSMEVKNILSVEDSILFLSGTKFGEFAVTPDSTFLEKQVNNETVWRHIYRGGILLELDGNADKVNFLVARDSDIEVVTVSGETGEFESSYFISFIGYRFAPLIFRNVEKNITYLAKFTTTYEISSFSPSGTDWKYHKVQTLTSTWIDRILDVQFDEEDFIYLNGIFYNAENGSGVLLTKLSPNGELVWEKRYDNAGDLWASSKKSVINDDVIYLTGKKINQAGAWDQFVLAYSLDDGRLLKECSVIEAGDHRFSSRGVMFYEGTLYTFGVFNNRVDLALSLRSFDFSDLTSSSEEASSTMGMNIKVYPNPADRRGRVSVELPVPHQLSRIHVASVNGAEVATFPLSDNQTVVKITDLPSGAYVLYAYNRAGEVVARRRFVVQ